MNKGYRPLKYAVVEIVSQKNSPEDTIIAAIITFPGGPEKRVYEVSCPMDKWYISVLVKENLSGSEDHARTLLKA